MVLSSSTHTEINTRKKGYITIKLMHKVKYWHAFHWLHHKQITIKSLCQIAVCNRNYFVACSQHNWRFADVWLICNVHLMSIPIITIRIYFLSYIFCFIFSGHTYTMEKMHFCVRLETVTRCLSLFLIQRGDRTFSDHVRLWVVKIYVL